MKNEKFSRLILVAAPWLILVVMVIGAYLPIFRGQKYLLPVTPHDPRDFFRGNYVDLQYPFSNIPRKDISIGLDSRRVYYFGDRLFLDLQKDGDSLKPVGIYDRAEQVKHIRLKVQPRWQFDATHTHLDLVAGLESFFAPKDAAEAWENALRDRLVFAEVAIDAAGNARLTRLVKKEKPAPVKAPKEEE